MLGKANTGALKGKALHRFIDNMQLELQRIHDTINRTWFAPDTAG